jgi:hypothetical protein
MCSRIMGVVDAFKMPCRYHCSDGTVKDRFRNIETLKDFALPQAVSVRFAIDHD